ncbi:MAG: pirin family protein [Burkholderiaceae bacterium]
MMHQATLAEELIVQAMRHGAGFRAQGIRGDDEIMDPFLMVDHFWMSEPTFGPHPHAGFSAVTYLFEDSESAFQNRDSRGDDSLIQPGGLHWTNAGSGILHDEVPVRRGHNAHGLQIFVNLSAARKHQDPAVMRLEREKMPLIEQPGGAVVKLVFGAYEDTTRRVEPLLPLPTDASLFDIQLEAGTRMSYPLESGSTVFLLVVSGSAIIDKTRLDAGKAVAFDRVGGELNVRADQATRFALFLGEPLGEPVVRHGPFVMNSQIDIDKAIADYQAGKMGHL